jgi:hypothetical protein
VYVSSKVCWPHKCARLLVFNADHDEEQIKLASRSLVMQVGNLALLLRAHVVQRGRSMMCLHLTRILCVDAALKQGHTKCTKPYSNIRRTAGSCRLSGVWTHASRTALGQTCRHHAHRPAAVVVAAVVAAAAAAAAALINTRCYAMREATVLTHRRCAQRRTTATAEAMAGASA